MLTRITWITLYHDNSPSYNCIKNLRYSVRTKAIEQMSYLGAGPKHFGTWGRNPNSISQPLQGIIFKHVTISCFLMVLNFCCLRQLASLYVMEWHSQQQSFILIWLRSWHKSLLRTGFIQRQVTMQQSSINHVVASFCLCCAEKRIAGKPLQSQ